MEKRRDLNKTLIVRRLRTVREIAGFVPGVNENLDPLSERDKERERRKITGMGLYSVVEAPVDNRSYFRRVLDAVGNMLSWAYNTEIINFRGK